MGKAKTPWQQAQDDFIAAMEGSGGYVERFIDASELVGRANGRINSNVRAAPADFLVTKEGSTFYAEVKSSHDKTAFRFSQIEASQWTAARQVTKRGGVYNFFVRSLHEGRPPRWFCFPAALVISTKDVHEKKSIAWADAKNEEVDL